VIEVPMLHGVHSSQLGRPGTSLRNAPCPHAQKPLVAYRCGDVVLAPFPVHGPV
jgi:hypothetical protein